MNEFNIVSKEPGPIQFQVVDSFLVNNVRWLQYRASAEVHLDLILPPSGRGLDRIGWVRRLSENTNTFSAYGDSTTRVMLAQLGIHDCRLASVDNPQTGLRRITGYTYAYRDAGGSLHYLVDEDHIRMAYVTACSYISGVEGDAAGQLPDLQLTVVNQPGLPIWMSWQQQASGETIFSVIDVAGRRIATRDLGVLPEGHHEFRWSDFGDHAAQLPAGIYWIALQVGKVHKVKKCVLVK